jgi:hypothetical protein
MDTDITERLDRSFGDGPPLGETAQVVALGRRALRRRRMAGAAGAAAACLVLGGAALAGLGTSSPSSDPGVAVDPSTAAADAPVDFRPKDSIGLSLDVMNYDAEQQVFTAREGVEVLEYVPDPLRTDPPDASAGFEIRYQGKVEWYLVQSGEGSTSVVHARAGKSAPDLETWLDRVAAEETW